MNNIIIWYRDKDDIKIKGLSINNFISINAIYSNIWVDLPVNLEKEISMQPNSSYTVWNNNGKVFQHLFNRFNSLNKRIKLRLIDRFEYSTRIDSISDFRFELIMILCLYLDFKSIKNLLSTNSKLYTNVWEDNQKFWFNIYIIRFGKTPFSAKSWNWKKIYRKKLLENTT